MMWAENLFCSGWSGSSVNATEQMMFLHERPCIVDAALLGIHAVFILLSISLSIYLACIILHKGCKGGTGQPKEKRRWVKLPLDKFRWITASLIIIFLTSLTAEGVLFENLTSSTNIHLYVPHILAIISLVMSLVLCDRVEKSNKPAILIVCLPYWTAIIVCLSLKTSTRRQILDTEVTSPRYVFTCVCLALYILMFLAELYILGKLTYISRHHQRHLVSPDGVRTLTYIQPYVCTLSQITWHWMTSFLKGAHHKELVLADLGKLPEADHTEHTFQQFKNIYEKETLKAQKTGKTPSLWKCYFSFSGRRMMFTGLTKLVADQMMYVGPVLVSYTTKYTALNYNTWGGHLNNTVAPITNYTTIDMHNITFEEYFSNGYVLVIFMFMATLVFAIFWQNQFYHCVYEGIRVKGAVQSMVLDKVLRLSSSALNDEKFSHGKVINHMSTDILNIFWFFYVGHFVWLLPILVIVGIALLYAQLGVSALIGGLLFAVLAPVNFILGRKLSSLQDKCMDKSDERLKRSRELLQNIKLLKLYAWELLFCENVLCTRREELWLLLYATLVRMISVIFTLAAPMAACLVTILLYPHFESEALETGKLYSAIAIFSVLSMNLWIVYFVMNIVCHGWVSTRRIQKFLLAQEVKDVADILGEIDHELPDQEQVPLMSYYNDNKVSLSNQVYAEHSNQNNVVECAPRKGAKIMEMEEASFSWNAADDDSENVRALKDINWTLHEGQLVLIVGQVGSGKSSLLSALLNEMFICGGSTKWHRKPSMAYVPQTAWLMNASVRENILFSRTMDRKMYDETIDMCALGQDLKQMVAGDRTEVGEKGINLSGGQKQRLSLARTIYSDAELVLLDDPLSALDAPVAQHIFAAAIQGHLLQHNKTVLLVTHQLSYLPHADWIISLKGGAIAYQGPPSELTNEVEQQLAEWLQEGLESIAKNQDGNKGKCQPSDDIIKENNILARERRGSHISTSNWMFGRPSITPIDIDNKSLPPKRDVFKQIVEQDSDFIDDTGRLIEEEEHQYGVVPFRVYVRYAQAATYFVSVLSLVGFAAYMATRIASDYWLGRWTDAKHLAMADWLAANGSLVCNTTACVNALPQEEEEYYLHSYIALCVATIVLVIIAMLAQEGMAILAAKNLHHRLLTNIIKAPMRFFDVTPIGRILNRMSGDTDIIDSKMTVSENEVYYCVMYVIGGIIVNAVASPFFLIPAVPMFVIYVLIQRFYISPSRELQRLDCITKSPILNQLSEALNGLSSIRAYKVRQRYMKRMFKAVDDNNTAFLFLHTANVWMGIRLDFLGAVVVLAASLTSITACLHGYIPPGQAGLAMAYAVMICTFLNWAMRTVSELEMFFNSVERVVAYTDVSQEKATLPHEGGIKGSVWPTNGAIKYDKVALRYDENLTPVLKDFSVDIKGGQKVGICGRTGSGKSTMTLGLFRLIDICDGHILIDGVDICGVPLQELRSALSIIPQDPVLFCGSIRMNIDPEGKETDSLIWESLEIAQLKDAIMKLPGKLDAQVTEGGDNFSVGQKQLFCLARAFIRKSRILVMDEATSSIDLQTDSIIQQILTSSFSDRTILTIAHRTSTILHCDVIIVIQDGRLVEHDTPEQLLSRDSIFSTMVKAKH